MTIKTFSQRFVPEDTTEKESVPERNLWAAALERRIRDVCNKAQSEGGTGEINNRHCREAITWLRNPSKEPATFLWICEVLEISPKTVRRFIFELKKSGKRFDCGTTMF